MQSAFAPKPGRPTATANPATEETYDLKGLNLKDPDEIMPPGESPWTINSRMYARNDAESRVASRTRKGASILSLPNGETLNVQNVASNTGDAPFTRTDSATYTAVAMPFTPSANGPLSRLDLNIKKTLGATGHVIVEIRNDNSGLPGSTILAQSSILNNLVTTAYAYVTMRFIDAPTLVSGTKYWIYAYIQDNGTGTFNLDKTAATGAYSTSDGSTWTALGYSVNFKTYLATAGAIRGFSLRYPSDATKNLILFAQNDKIYSVPKTGGAPTQIDSGLNSSGSPVRFAQVDNNSYWVNGFDQARQWDGTTVTNVGGTIPSLSPSNIIFWKQRFFIISANNRVDFSDIFVPGTTPTWSSVNFFYIGSPQSADHITGWEIFQDHLVIFTHESKWTILGSDISTFTYKQAVGTKGAVSQEAMDADRNNIYFMSDDMQVYSTNGATDRLLSDKLQPEFQGITDPTKVRIHVYRNQVRVYYPKTPSSFANRMALYDIALDQWFLDTDHPVMGSAELYLDDNQLIEFSSLIGQVFFGETQFSDLGKDIDYKFWTNYKTYAYRRRTGQTFGGGSAKKRIKRFRPVVRVTESNFIMRVGKDMDFANSPDMRDYLVAGNGAVWGQWVYGDGTTWGTTRQIQNRSGMSGRGQYIQYRFERKGVETPVELYGYISQYKVGRQK